MSSLLVYALERMVPGALIPIPPPDHNVVHLEFMCVAQYLQMLSSKKCLGSLLWPQKLEL